MPATNGGIIATTAVAKIELSDNITLFYPHRWEKTVSRPKPTVKRAYVSQDNDGIAYVLFTDGHELVVHEHFVPMVAPTHQLEAVWLRLGDTHIATFHPRRQYPVNRTPIGFARLAAGWTPQRFAEYWTAAVDYAKAGQAVTRLVRPAAGLGGPR